MRKDLVKQEEDRRSQLVPLSKSQESLLRVLRDPTHANLKREEIIKLADISPATYYSAWKDSNFIAHLETAMAEYRAENDFAVLHNLAAQARTTQNHNMITLYQKLQGRLREGGDKPAQIILVIGNGTIERPPFEGKKIIDVTPEDDDGIKA